MRKPVNIELVKKVLFYFLLGTALITLLNMIVIIVFPMWLMFSSFSVIRLYTVALFLRKFLLLPVSILSCALIIIMAYSVRKQKILLPMLMLPYLIYDTSVLFDFVMKSFTGYYSSAVPYLFHIIPNILLAALIIIYTILCLQQKPKRTDISHKPRNKKTLSVLKALIVTAVTVVVFSLPAVPIYFYNRSLPPPNTMLGDNEVYYEDIKTINKKTQQIDLADVFTFEWDRVVFTLSPAFTAEERARFGVEGESSPFDGATSKLRVLFILDNKVAYDFMYDTAYLEFDPLDISVAREDAQFTISKSGKLLTLTLNE